MTKNSPLKVNIEVYEVRILSPIYIYNAMSLSNELSSRRHPLINVICITFNSIFFYFAFIVIINRPIHDNGTCAVKLLFSYSFIHFLRNNQIF